MFLIYHLFHYKKIEKYISCHKKHYITQKQMQLFSKKSDIVKRDESPFVLIDCSGSTRTVFNYNNEDLTKYYTNNSNFDDNQTRISLKLPQGKFKTVFEFEMELFQNMIKENNINECYLFTWNDDYTRIGKISIEDMDKNDLKIDPTALNFKDKKIYCKGGTKIVPVLNKIKETIIEEKLNNKDIYIYTDGEIEDESELSTIFNELFRFDINIYINTIEPHKSNYLISNCCVGNSLCKFLKNNSKTNLIKNINNYNYFHKDKPFVSLYNFDVPEGYIPFNDNIFPISKVNEFTDFLKQEIKNFNNDLSQKTEKNIINNDSELLKLAYDLTRTLFYITKGKDMRYRNLIVDSFSKYFENTSIYSKIRGLLMNEIDNHVNHRSATYQEYKNEKKDLVEKSKMSMMENTLNAITYNNSNMYITFPFNTTKGQYIIKSLSENVTGNIHIWKNVYKNSGICVKDSVLPVIPLDIISNPDNDQCLRQWVSINYSHQYNKKSISGSVLSLFLIDMLKVNISNVSENVKNTYKKIAKIMLEESTSANETILKNLYLGNKFTGFYAFETYLHKNNIDLSPVSLWLSILDCINDEKLTCAQRNIYKEEEIDLNYWEKTKEKLPTIMEKMMGQKYIIPCHTIIGDIICYNNYISENDYNNCQSEYKCDVCDTIIKKEQIVLNKDFDDMENLEILDNYKNNTEIITINNIDTNELIKINDLDFNIKSFQFTNVIITDLLNISKVTIRTKEEFNNKVHAKYPYMANLDMTNVCLAGGFCRSVLLDQQMKDFDFFIYGLNSDQEYEERLSKLIKDLTNKIKECEKEEERNKYKFLYLYKPLFNVFEIIYVYDPTNHFKDNFMVDNFIDYKYKTLKSFDKKNITPADEFYFEDGDEKGIKLKQRYQFIMAKYNSINDVLSRFDISPSRVAYDGKEVYFNQSSYMSYKYMVNIIEMDTDKYTDMYDSRVSKYLSYGFDILFQQNEIENIDVFKNKFKINNSKLNLCTLNFDINTIDNNNIILKHDSHKKALLELLIDIEKEQNDSGKSGLYRSSMFCGLASILRYVCINQIKYKFLPELINSNENGELVFTNGTHKLTFIDEVRINTYQINKWFEDNNWKPSTKHIEVERMPHNSNYEKFEKIREIKKENQEKLKNNREFHEYMDLIKEESNIDSVSENEDEERKKNEE